MAEPKPLPSAEGLSLSRWSRLKRATRTESAPNVPVHPELGEGFDSTTAASDNASSHSPARRGDPHADLQRTQASVEVDALPPLSSISMAEDFTPFMQAKVPQALKQQALKALFKEPHFNVMDGLDTYIDDYTVFEPITPEVMATLSSWKTIMNPPQQVVTPGGYAVDVESEEGKGVLAARAEFVEANASLQPSAGGVEVPSPAARERAEGEGGESAEPTSETINLVSKDEPLQLSDEAHAITLTPTLSRAAGEGAKPHPRYGKRVGDFSASAHETADDAVSESSLSEPDQTTSAAPKSIAQ